MIRGNVWSQKLVGNLFEMSCNTVLAYCVTIYMMQLQILIFLLFCLIPAKQFSSRMAQCYSSLKRGLYKWNISLSSTNQCWCITSSDFLLFQMKWMAKILKKKFKIIVQKFGSQLSILNHLIVLIPHADNDKIFTEIDLKVTFLKWCLLLGRKTNLSSALKHYILSKKWWLIQAILFMLSLIPVKPLAF